ncbi:MAG: helix-turn-helix domain-containing protein [Deltaproteobacteria bacterium]|nr:helix-turn-helix domain-containing protein [Deltaproteobacteria bacterium]
MTVEEAFGLTLQGLRKARKMSQEGLGFESGYHRTYISQLERGQKSPSLKTVFQLAAALRASPAEIVSSVERILSRSGQPPEPFDGCDS